MLSHAYLVLYNVTLALGWSYVMFLYVSHLAQHHGLSPKHTLWAELEQPLKLFQTAAVLEVVHAAVGLVRSNAALTAFQVASRVALVWPVLHSFAAAQASVGLPMLLAAWCITEIVRYTYYVLNLLGVDAGPLTWVRYTFFIVLYPVGVTGELLCSYGALPAAAQTQKFSILMPNAWNFGFSFYHALMIFMLLYIPIFPQLYLHMFAQRVKVLGGQPKKQQ